MVVYCAFAIRQQVTFQLRTSTNLVEAMTSSDYSLRANNKEIKGALSDFNLLLNQLADKLAEQSLITREKQILLSKVTDQIDVAVIACDENNHITLMNPSAERLFSERFENIEGTPIKSLGLQNVVNEAVNTVTEFAIGKNKRKVYVRTDRFFEHGKPHHLIFITDIQQILRDEERQAWQKLLRVLSHEINNSLTPIASIGETLVSEIKSPENQQTLSEQTKLNLSDGLTVITERAHALNHFIQDYQQLSRLPPPSKRKVMLQEFLHNIAKLFEPVNIDVRDANLSVFADSEQLQQVLVNLIKNAHEANLAKSNEEALVVINCKTNQQFVEIEIVDCGKGIKNADNLFVPFYTTKKKGSGIGLTLSRQIALNHGGMLHLENVLENENIVGAKAVLSIPTSNSSF